MIKDGDLAILVLQLGDYQLLKGFTCDDGDLLERLVVLGGEDLDGGELC